MKFNRIVDKYLTRYAVGNQWSIVSSSTDGIDNVVVIPALAESEHLFGTLAALSRNPESDLERTLVMCVVNNIAEGITSSGDIDDNQKTLNILQSIIGKSRLEGKMTHLPGQRFLDEIERNRLRLAFVDASSRGHELPAKIAGVGMARKIGCDKALTLFDYDSKGIKLIFSLDADTMVEENYLSAVRACFENMGCVASVISYAHRYPERWEERAAIICYEIFLRYYVMGLEYSRSEYAFHSIGSAMAFTSEGYACVRGMNRRKAGEDFYFLNKLAKTGVVAKTDKTRVFPSSRVSERVPFGTGKRVGRFLNGDSEEYLLYNPSVFEVLREWLSFMHSAGKIGLDNIMSRARQIHPELEVFLETRKFKEIWPRLVRNSGSGDSLKNNFNCWFDGFRTMKLINHLTRNGIPPVNMFTALKILFEMRGEQAYLNFETRVVPSIPDQEKILDYMRRCSRQIS